MQPLRQTAESGIRSMVFEAASLSALLGESLPAQLEARLVEHVRSRRWFRGKARDVRSLEVLERIELREQPHEVLIVLVRIRYLNEPEETYVLPLAAAPAGQDEAGSHERLFLLSSPRESSVYDPTGNDDFSQLLLRMFAQRETRGQNGRVIAKPSGELTALADKKLPPRVPSGEQSNTTIFFGRELIVKLFRQLESGTNPDVELNDFLWRAGYRHVPEPLGSVSYSRDGVDFTLGIAQRFVSSEGIAWEVSLELLQQSFEHARKLAASQVDLQFPASRDLLDSAKERPPENLEGFISGYASFAMLLAERTAELHTVLASGTEPAIAPEPFTIEYQRSLVHNTRERISNAFELLTRQLSKLTPEHRARAQEVLGRRATLNAELEVLERGVAHASRIRVHGDYHLGQVLYSEDDFIILDFEGEPAQPIAERRQKGSALYDVCGMLRSFHYAATVTLQSEKFSNADRELLGPWSEAWYRWTSAQFLCAYLRKARESGRAVFLPEDPAELRALLRLHLIDKCSYELSYELNNRPTWVGVPLAGLLNLTSAS